MAGDVPMHVQEPNGTIPLARPMNNNHHPMKRMRNSENIVSFSKTFSNQYYQ
jgi:hypothetical protein